MKDYFGVADPVRALVPPEGYEGVHEVGYSWAIQGKQRENTTWISPADWNQIIANLRGLLKIPGYTSLPEDANSPWILRDAITSFSTSKIVELLPGVVTGQFPALAAYLTADAGFVSAVSDAALGGDLAPAALAATTNIVLSGEQSIDGVMTNGTEVLLPKQSDPTENGVYVTAAGAWTRRADADSASELAGYSIYITGGNTQAGTTWKCSIAFGDTLDTDPCPWTMIRDGALSPAMTAALAEKANDSVVVKTSGDQTIGGIKTFSEKPVVPNESFALTKLANMATGKLLGRGTAGDGPVLPITMGYGLTVKDNNTLALHDMLQAAAYRLEASGIYQLFVEGTATDDQAVDVDGNVIAYASRSLSDYIAVIPSTLYSRSAGGQMVAFYDANKTPIAGAGVTTRVFKTPATAKYIRASMLTSNKATTLIVKGGDLPSLSPTFAYRMFMRDILVHKEQVWPALFDSVDRKLFNEFKVTERNAKFLERDSPNLFDKRAIFAGQREAYGSITADASNNVSEMIAVTPNTDYIISEGNYVNQYDINGLYITGHGSTVTQFTTTANTYFLRITVRTVTLDTLMLVQGTALPGTYQAYHKYNLASSINVPLPPGVTKRFDGKIWNVLGDSITQESYSYWSYLIDPLGIATLNNYGIGGTAIAVRAAPWDTNAMCLRSATMADPADLITCLGGTNDFSTGVPLGAAGSTNNAEFNGALNEMLDNFISIYPLSTIAMFTPTPRQSMVNGSTGLDLRDYSDAIIARCEERYIPVCDLTRASIFKPFNATNMATYMPDGLHPSDPDGHQGVAFNQMLRFLEAL